jgi:hypothetical protein
VLVSVTVLYVSDQNITNDIIFLFTIVLEDDFIVISIDLFTIKKKTQQKTHFTATFVVGVDIQKGIFDIYIFILNMFQ